MLFWIVFWSAIAGVLVAILEGLAVGDDPEDERASGGASLRDADDFGDYD